MHKIRIETKDSPVIPKLWKVYLDDIDISSLISGLTLKADVDDVARVVLDCVAEIEIDGDIPVDLGALTATMTAEDIKRLLDAAEAKRRGE